MTNTKAIYEISENEDQLLCTRYQALASNTMDYWVNNSEKPQSMEILTSAISKAAVSKSSTLHLYFHIPFCANSCRFCFIPNERLRKNTASAQRYAESLVKQMKSMLELSKAKELPIASVAFGGGSPDRLGKEIGIVLEYLTNLSGFDHKTEVTCEFALNTVSNDFLDTIGMYPITKVSFGMQTLNEKIRKEMRLFPKPINKLKKITARLKEIAPIINVDIMTGLPGQTLTDVVSDVSFLAGIDGIDAISSHLFIPGESPVLVADILKGTLPKLPNHPMQAKMRLETYASLLRKGWMRKGINTYYNHQEIDPQAMEKINGNEVIPGGRYETFILAAGAQAVSYLPGVRLENLGDIEEWMESIEQGEQPYDLNSCSLAHQKDFALWHFPLKYNGITKELFQELNDTGAVSKDQIDSFHQMIDEGMIFEEENQYVLSLLGEVFLGHIVRALKSPGEGQIVDQHIKQGFNQARELANECV